MTDVLDIDVDEAFAPGDLLDEEVLVEEPDFDAGAGSGVGRLQKILAAHSDNDPLLGLTEQELTDLGMKVVSEWEADKEGNREWREKVSRALDAATQENIPLKTYPFGDKSSNVHYPLLTVTSLQFAARAGPALMKGDESIQVKTFGPDESGKKRARAERVKAFANYKLIYGVEDWEGGVDSMLHQLSTVGTAFRKVYHDPIEDQPVVDFVSPLRLTVPADARSLRTAPRVTHDFDRHPYEIEGMMARGLYAERVLVGEGQDDQASRVLLEQHRMVDLDGDGLPEPYIVTVDQQTSQVLRIEPGFVEGDVEEDSEGGVRAIKRWMPFVKVPFIPDPKGRFYDIGFGHLMEPLLAVINTIINQLVDAGHAEVAGGGFISAGLRLQGAQGGAIRFQPAEYKVVNATGDELRNSIVERTLPKPSPVLFQLLSMLMEAARDIGSVNNIMTGDIPQNTQATTVLASIEQGLQVFSSIYKRIFRAFREEYRLFVECLARYGDPEEYVEFHDLKAAEMMGHNGGPPLAEPGRPPEQAAQPQAPEPVPTLEQDFAAAGLDIRPVSDPTAVTKMQALAKAQFLLQFVGKGVINDRLAVQRSLEAADIPDIEELMAVPQAPPPPGAIEKAALELSGMEIEQQGKKADASLKIARAAEIATRVRMDDPTDPVGGMDMNFSIPAGAPPQ